ncbi:MAG: hypothetical protein V2I65_01880 [Paracoccaceae bacterium]|jgi:HSP20 family molecular chaperone IbpA|nr:hypothetical protein [Paracoccaceae bacterium]
MDEDKRKKLDETMSELDLRLGGLLGKLGDALNEAVSRLETGDDGEVRRTHEIQTPKGPLRAETGVRVRLGGLDAGAVRRPARDPARPVNAADGTPGRNPDAATARPRAGEPQCAGSEPAMQDTPDRGTTGDDAGLLPRRPHVEAYRDGPRWVLCADLPGVTLPEIDVRIGPGHDGPDTPAATGDGAAPPGEGGRSILIETRGARRYALEHPLPPDARPDDMQIVLRNGVLEIALGTGNDGGPA